MEIGRAVSYIFEDRDWLAKLLPLLLLGLFSFTILPMALILGYMLQLARNVRDGLPRPLPKWTDWQTKFQIGGHLMLAIIFYNLPLILTSLCSWTILNGIARGFMGPFTSFFIFCCIVPFGFVYGLFSWAILATGTTEYIETGEWQRLFRVGHLWDVMRSHQTIVFQWMLYAFLANIGVAVLGAIPCLGWIAILLFATPVQGHLLGQFAHKIGITNQPKAKKSQSYS